MVHVSIGGMQLKSWTSYFRINLPTVKVLRAAGRAGGSPKADTFKAGDVFLAVSVWKVTAKMRAFAKAGLHGQLT